MPHQILSSLALFKSPKPTLSSPEPSVVFPKKKRQKTIPSSSYSVQWEGDIVNKFVERGMLSSNVTVASNFRKKTKVSSVGRKWDDK